MTPAVEGANSKLVDGIVISDADIQDSWMKRALTKDW